MTHTSDLRRYTIGFTLSVILTAIPFAVVMNHGGLSTALVVVIIIICALLQLYVQLYYFLHLGDKARPRWRLLMFGFATLVVVIVVGGSLWIMDNLSYHMMDETNLQNSSLPDQRGF